MEVIQRYKVQIAIGVAVVVSIALVGLVFSSGRPACSPVGSLAPRVDADLIDQKALASTDKSAQLNASTYLILLDEPNGFLELGMKEFIRVKDKDFDTLSVEYDCAKLDIKLTKTSTVASAKADAQVTYQVADVNLHTRKPGADKFEHLCKADGSSLPAFDSSKERYSCRGTIALNCLNTEKDSRGNDYLKTLAEIVFNVLELELDSDAKMVADGKWTRNPKANSCPTRTQ